MTLSTASVPDVDSTAPDFTLPSTEGSDVALSSFRGKTNVVLAFFPLAFTGVCTAELCAFTDDYSRFAEVDAEVLGISVDSVPTLREFKAKHKMTLNLLSDFKRDVCRLYGTLLEDPFYSSRAYVIVDKEGLVRWTYVESELGHKRDNAELLGQLESIG